MDRILEVRPDDLLAVVEPGILNAELGRALARPLVGARPREPRDLDRRREHRDRRRGTALREVRRGARRRPRRRPRPRRRAALRLGHRSVKGVTGLDLTSLVIGSEGTLGVVVGATLKLRRLIPGETRTLAATFPTSAPRRRATAVTAAGLQPAIMELMDATSLAAVHALLSSPRPNPGSRS
jgi:glycolate oxidase